MTKGVITDILKEINALPDLSVDNVIEKIASEMKTPYEDGKIWSDIAKNWKDAGLGINYKWYNDKALLHCAAEGGCERVIDALIKNGANIEVGDKHGNTPLHYAAVSGHIDIVNTLINKGADVNKTGGDETTPLHYAVEYSHIEVAKVLINKGAKVNVVDRVGCTPLFFAIENNLVEIAKILIDKGADVNETGEQDLSPIIDMVRRRRTPLHLTAKKGQVEIVKVLIDKGADVNKEDENGRTLLHFAAEKGHVEIVKALIDKGADINKADKDEDISLGFAVSNYHNRYYTNNDNHTKMVKTLVGHIAKLEAAGLHVSQDNLQLKDSVQLEYNSDIASSYREGLRKYKEEIEKLTKEDKPLYDFLKESNINELASIWEKNEDIRSNTNSHYKANRWTMMEEKP